MRFIIILVTFTAWLMAASCLILAFTASLKLEWYQYLLYGTGTIYFPIHLYKEYKRLMPDPEEEPEYIKVLVYDELLRRMQIRVVHKDHFGPPYIPKPLYVKIDIKTYEYALNSILPLVYPEAKDIVLNFTERFMDIK